MPLSRPRWIVDDRSGAGDYLGHSAGVDVGSVVLYGVSGKVRFGMTATAMMRLDLGESNGNR